MSIIISLVPIFVLTLQLTSSQNTVSLSFCEIKDPERFASKIISVTTEVGFTPHGTFLLTDTCKRKSAEDAVVMYPKLGTAPEVSFDLDEGALQLLGPFFRPSGGVSRACGTFEGQLFYRKNFRLRHFGGGPQGNGFGPRGAYRLAFVMKSVQEIRPC